MVATYHLNANDISIELLHSIQAAFKDKTIDIVVSQAEPIDDTEYLLSSHANRAHLERAMKELDEGKGITFTLEEFEQRFGGDKPTSQT